MVKSTRLVPTDWEFTPWVRNKINLELGSEIKSCERFGVVIEQEKEKESLMIERLSSLWSPL